MKNGQSRETGNIWCTRLRQTKQEHNTICVGHHYTQTIIKIKQIRHEPFYKQLEVVYGHGQSRICGGAMRSNRKSCDRKSRQSRDRN